MSFPRARAQPPFAFFNTIVIPSVIAFVGGIAVFFVLINRQDQDVVQALSEPRQPLVHSNTVMLPPLPAPLPAAAKQKKATTPAPTQPDASANHASPKASRPTPVLVDDGWTPAHPVSGHMPSPIYPVIALRHGQHGTVRLRARIDVDGKVQNIDIVSGSGSHWLDEAAGEALDRWKFIPAYNHNHPVESQIVISFAFSPKADEG